ncbi:mandelate racemase/muconate lactonizing enzyme family protein [Halomicrobium sp. LC1Hm]|uniref:mandelate racemase/muconate lactonizing enzyme family protein n=1 Tax=Halomicrobium sp. LC1Hm TaxID=2610902 RepID=UPI0012984A50|nr:o-succinylbenzoate synthase [Halomicrobium sp. LC1Hm]QGA82619.1 O-succinylbenzoate synthase [Halomicrobium sp. LC1Hm]
MTLNRFTLPLTTPLSTAHGRIESREGFVVGFEHRGTVGVGEATPLPGWTESLDDCEAALTTALETYAERGHSAALLELDAATVPAARHGVATALLDADARADGVSLARWFDPDAGTGSVPVNATVGDGSVEETTRAARAAVDDGFDCLKLKAGVRSVADDVERVRAVRAAVGDDVTIRVDANGAWDRDSARRAFEAFAPLGVAYVEQPLPATDLDGHAALGNETVGVAIDEGFCEHTAAAVLATDVDAVILKPMVLGGPGNAHTIAMRARESGIEPIVTTTIDAAVARAAAIHVAAAIPAVEPCGLATADALADDLTDDPAPVSDGRIAVPEGEGLGIDPEEVGL